MKNGYIYEARMLMVEKLGRYLKDSEVVVHIDGDKRNNDPENLRVILRSDIGGWGKRKLEPNCVCEACGKEFRIKPSHKPNTKFCSAKCAGRKSSAGKGSEYYKLKHRPYLERLKKGIEK
jgi:hypothetical protein